MQVLNALATVGEVDDQMARYAFHGASERGVPPIAELIRPLYPSGIGRKPAALGRSAALIRVRAVMLRQRYRLLGGTTPTIDIC